MRQARFLSPKSEHILNEDPLPAGKYLVGTAFVKRQDRAGNNVIWYKLYGPNGKGGYTPSKIPVRTPSGKTVYRGDIYLHPGLESKGCLTGGSDVGKEAKNYPSSEKYDRIRKMLRETKIMNYNGHEFNGTLIVK